MEWGDQPWCQRDSTKKGPRWAQPQKQRLLPKKTPLGADLSLGLFFLFDQKAAGAAGEIPPPPTGSGGLQDGP